MCTIDVHEKARSYLVYKLGSSQLYYSYCGVIFRDGEREITLNVFSWVYNFFVLNGRTRRQEQSCRSTVQPGPP